MCCFDFNNELVLGNFKEQTLLEIFNGDVFQQLRKHHEKGTCSESDFICNNCDQLKDKSDIVIFNNRIDRDSRANYTSTAVNDLSRSL